MTLMICMFRMISSSVVMTRYWRWHRKAFVWVISDGLARKTPAMTDSNSSIVNGVILRLVCMRLYDDH